MQKIKNSHAGAGEETLRRTFVPQAKEANSLHWSRKALDRNNNDKNPQKHLGKKFF